MATLALTPSFDGYLREDAATTNLSTGTTAFVQNASAGARRRAVLVFDLSALPANAVISSALLSIQCSNAAAGNGTCTADIIDIDNNGAYGYPNLVGTEMTWNKRNASDDWAVAGGDFGDVSWTATTFAVPTSISVMADINLTDGIAAALAQYENPTQVGILLHQTAGTDRSWRLYTSEEASQQKPTLTITYTVPSESNARPVVGGTKRYRFRAY